MSEPIIIEPVDTLEEAFYTRGVAQALDYVFRNHADIMDPKSREYAELARAYWAMPPRLMQ